MSWLDGVSEPTACELWAIELEDKLLSAELALLDAEAVLFGCPSNFAAARYLRALLDVVDLYDLAGSPSMVQPLLEAAR